MAGLATAFGSGAMTNSFEDFEKADVILVIGSNTTENHPIAALAIKRALRNGTKLIVADPRPIKLTKYAHLWLQHKPGTDVALINALANVILQEELWDKEFVWERTEGFEAYKESLKEYSPQKVERITGVSASLIERAARIFGAAKRGVIVYAMGITQHVRGTDNVLALANLAMLTGNVGREGTGVSPLRGQNNVQGACDMGALPNVLPGYAKVIDDSLRGKFEEVWGLSLPRKPGLTVVRMMQAAARGEIKGMYIMGENPLLSDPQIEHVKEALESLEFLVVQDIFLTETAELADVVLPAASFAEKEGTFTNTERRVLQVRKAIEPPGEAKPDWVIIKELAQKLKANFNYRDPKEIMDEINKLVPAYAGITYERLDKTGLQWPCLSTTHPGTKRLHEGKFARGKGQFTPVCYIPSSELPDDEYPLVLITGRVLFHYHTGTMSRRTHINSLFSKGYVEINPEDAVALNIEDGETVLIKSRHGELKAPVKISERVGPGTIFSNFHFWEVPINQITSEELDEKSGIPQIKAVAVKVEKI